jgi:Fur family transcriptional regulator, ferric uptake regulator
MTAEQIAATVQARFPSVNLSTVYRTLDALEELRVIDHIHLGHGRAVYHLTDETHQHLFCEQCERVQELPIAKLRPLFSLLEKEYAFQLDRRHFAIVGRCRDCAERA